MKILQLLFACTILFSLSVGKMSAQTVLCPFTGSTTIACGAASTIQDPGGNGNYSNNSNGYIVINPSCNAAISLSGAYTVENGWDYIYVYNGTGTGGTILQSLTGSGNLVFTGAASQTITLRFTSDGSVVSSGFNFALGFTGSCFNSNGNLTVSPSSASVCPGGTLALTASGGSNYSWSGGISNGIAFSPTSSGIYTVVSGGGQCPETKTVSVVYNPPITIAVPSTTVCANSAVTLSGGGGTTYTWSTGAVAPSIVVTPSANTNYTLYGVSNAGCNTQAIAGVTVAYTPTVGAVSSNGTNGSCPNSPVTLSGTGAVSYVWSGGISNGVAFTPTTSGTYTVTGTNVCGSATAAISISIHPLPLVTASVNNPTVCSGNPVIVNGGGAVSYVWTPAVANNVAFVPGTTGNYTVRGTSALGCTATAVVGVTVLITPNAPPVVTPTAICFGSVATLSATGATGYTWTPGSNLNAPTLTVSPPVSTTYTLVRTNGPCASTTTVNLVVNSLPVVVASATPSQVCAGTGVNIVIFGPITNTTYPGGFAASNMTLYPNSSTNYTVIGSNGNCTLSAVVPVVVDPSPVISITTSTNTICQGSSVTLNTSGATTFTWLPSQNTNNSTEVLSPPNTTLVSVTGINAAGCTATQQQLIVVNPLPNVAITSNPPFICANQSAAISVSNTPNVVYSWSNGATTNAINVNPAVTTTYVATGTNTLSGCQASNSFVLSVFISTFSVISPTALCNGSTATLSAVGPASTYSWTSVSGATVAPSVAVAPNVNTTYNVTGITGACSTSTTVAVIVNPLPNVTASVAKPTICRFETATITGTGATTYSWSNGATTPVLTFTLNISSTYTLTGTDLNGCSKTTTITQFVAICSDLEDLQGRSEGIDVYPNPNNGNFTVRAASAMQLLLIDALGRVVEKLNLNNDNRNEVTVGNLPNGIYFITGQDNGKKINKRIIVEP